MPSCLGAVLPKNRIWADDKDGKIMDEVKVYFFREELAESLIIYDGYPLQCNTIIKMVNNNWDCADKVSVDGAHVPKFVEHGNIEDAHIRVGFRSKLNQQLVCI